ncbi:MAG: hypothetical protein RIC52_18285 [Amphiplicatus sp.]
MPAERRSQPEHKSELPAPIIAAWFAPATAATVFSAAMVRLQLDAMNAWRELLCAPSIAFPPAVDADTLKVAADNVRAEKGKDPIKDEKKPKKSEKDLDEELDESFPASDPPSHNPGVANPPTDDKA